MKRSRIIKSHGGKEYPIYSKKKDRLTGLVTSCVGAVLSHVVKGKIEK